MMCSFSPNGCAVDDGSLASGHGKLRQRSEEDDDEETTGEHTIQLFSCCQNGNVFIFSAGSDVTTNASKFKTANAQPIAPANHAPLGF